MLNTEDSELEVQMLPSRNSQSIKTSGPNFDITGRVIIIKS